MCFRGRENAVALTRGEDRLSDSVGGLSCLSCVHTKLHVYSHECPKSSCFDENLDIIVRYLRNWSVSLLEGNRTSDFREFSKFKDIIVRYLRNWSVSLLEGNRTSDFREFSNFSKNRRFFSIRHSPRFFDQPSVCEECRFLIFSV
jgi:hypothetical protein